MDFVFGTLGGQCGSSEGGVLERGLANGSYGFAKSFQSLTKVLHSLSFHLLCNHSELTIFNSFNFVACEFSVESYRMEIFRVFEGLAMCCILAVYKCVEERLKKDGVLVVGKRRLFPKKRRVSGAKTSFFESKYLVFFRKKRRLFPLNLISALERCRFGRKSPKNTENFH